ncbi:MAG: hypothetical protein ACD_75C00940G0001 [uncultured bacterium]|nr:MAG: hypothetical protein ACD_75C00940G0001 [uncultured bacterium]
MFGVGGNAFQADNQKFPQGSYVLIGSTQNTHRFGLFGKARYRAAPDGLVRQNSIEILAVFCFIGGEKGGPQLTAANQAIFNQCDKPGIGPVGVGDSREKSLEDKVVMRSVRLAEFFQLFAIHGHPPQHEEKQILQVGGFFRFAAHPLDGAASVFGGFLALKAKHSDSPFYGWSSIQISFFTLPLDCLTFFYIAVIIG